MNILSALQISNVNQSHVIAPPIPNGTMLVNIMLIQAIITGIAFIVILAFSIWYVWIRVTPRAYILAKLDGVWQIIQTINFKIGDKTVTWNGKGYNLDEQTDDTVMLSKRGRKPFIFFEVDNPNPIYFIREKNLKRNSETFELTTNNRWLKQIFGSGNEKTLLLLCCILAVAVVILSSALIYLSQNPQSLYHPVVTNGTKIIIQNATSPVTQVTP